MGVSNLFAVKTSKVMGLKLHIIVFLIFYTFCFYLISRVKWFPFAIFILSFMGLCYGMNNIVTMMAA